MRILVVSQYFYPETFRINDVVKELVRRGHTVTVLTGLPNYPEGDIFAGYEKASECVEDYFGALVYRCKLRPRKKGSFNLALNYVSFARQAKKTIKRIKPDFDIIYFYEPSPITSGFPALWYGKKHKIKTIIYNMDIWPDCVRDSRNGKTMSKLNPIYLLAKLASRRVYKRFDCIVNKCDEFGCYLHDLFKIPLSKMKTLSEHAEETYLSVPEKPIDNGYIDFVFLGNIGKAQNCDQMIEAFNRIENSSARLHFVGDGSYISELKGLADRLGLSNRIIFHERQSVEGVIKYYEMADICVLALSNRTTSGLTPPGKLFSYMAAAKPIVASINGSAARIIKESNCGIVSKADDVDLLAKSMDYCIKNFKSVSLLGSNGRKEFIKKYTLKAHIDSLERIFSEVLK